MTKTLKITDKDGEATFSPIINDPGCNIYLALQKDACSFKSAQEICGEVFTMDLASYMKLEFINLPAIMNPASEIRTEIDKKLGRLYPDLSLAKGKAMHIPALGVSELHTKQGLGTALVKIALS
ncbi:MAG: hypothetical protein ACRYE9_01015 [Janthinobacterium lividum]